MGGVSPLAGTLEEALRAASQASLGCIFFVMRVRVVSKRIFDEKGWEGAIQQVLAACKEFNVSCGYPANANDMRCA